MGAKAFRILMRVKLEANYPNLTRIKTRAGPIAATLTTLVPVLLPSLPTAPVGLGLAAAHALAVAAVCLVRSQPLF